MTLQLLQNRAVRKPSGFNFSSDIAGADIELDSTIILSVGTDSSDEGIKIPRENAELYNFEHHFVLSEKKRGLAMLSKIGWPSWIVNLQKFLSQGEPSSICGWKYRCTTSAE